MANVFTGCTSDKEALRNLLYFNKTFYTSSCCKIFRRDVFRDIRFPKGLYYEDLATVYKVYLEAKRIAFTDEPMYGYRVNMNSIMHTRYSPKMLSCTTVSQQLYSDVSARYPELSQSAASISFNINRTVFLNLPRDRKEERRKVWAEIVKYRRAVLTDKHARKLERLMALATYAGSTMFHILSGLFKLYHSIR